MQAVLFAGFEELLDQRIEGAIAAGVYDLGLETLRAESFRVTDARVIYAAARCDPQRADATGGDRDSEGPPDQGA